MKQVRMKIKCSSTTLCKTMKEQMKDDSCEGIVVWDNPAPAVIGYKSTRGEGGIAFNYCPWCGGSYRKRIFPSKKIIKARDKDAKAEARLKCLEQNKFNEFKFK